MSLRIYIYIGYIIWFIYLVVYWRLLWIQDEHGHIFILASWFYSNDPTSSRTNLRPWKFACPWIGFQDLQFDACFYWGKPAGLGLDYCIYSTPTFHDFPSLFFMVFPHSWCLGLVFPEVFSKGVFSLGLHSRTILQAVLWTPWIHQGRPWRMGDSLVTIGLKMFKY